MGGGGVNEGEQRPPLFKLARLKGVFNHEVLGKKGKLVNEIEKTSY